MVNPLSLSVDSLAADAEAHLNLATDKAVLAVLQADDEEAALAIFEQGVASGALNGIVANALMRVIRYSKFPRVRERAEAQFYRLPGYTYEERQLLNARLMTTKAAVASKKTD